MKQKVIMVIVVIVGVSSVWLAYRLVRGPDDSYLLPDPLPARAVTPEIAEEAGVVRVAEVVVPEPPAPPRSSVIYDYSRVSGVVLPATLKRQSSWARAVVLIDDTNQKVLWAKKENDLVSIASMTKLMTLLVALKEIEASDELSASTTTKVSRSAASMGGTQVYMSVGDEYMLHNLLQAMMIHSANDAAYAVGEAVAPNNDMDRFIAMMNRSAREIGMRRARFYNPNGLPGSNRSTENRATCMDLAVLAKELTHYPVAVELAGTKRAAFKRQSGETQHMKNHNKLLSSVPGVTGMKTGFTNLAGFCLTVTAERDGRELILVGTGFKQSRERDTFLAGLLEWGFAQPVATATTGAATGD